jgi:DNA invertase Pin-like site-specific DNA recombinase
MMGAFAEFERALTKRRQAEGIARAKAEGKYKNAGRKASIDRDKVRELHNDGYGATEIAQQMGIGRASVYRVLRG